MIVTVSWCTTERVLIEGAVWRADLGERPPLREVLVGKACVWLNDATEADFEAAAAWGATQDPPATARRWPSGTADVLAKARRAEVADAEARLRPADPPAPAGRRRATKRG